MWHVISSAIRVGVASLRENPLRTLLSTLGVIIGVASLVAVLSLGDALQAFARTEIDRLTDAQAVAVEARTWHVVDGEWEPVRNVLELTQSDFEDLQGTLSMSSSGWMTRAGQARVSLPRTGRERTASISAVSSGIEATGRPLLAGGRNFSRREDAVNAPVVVLSWKLAEELADGRPPTSLIGEQVRVGRLPREVIGVWEGTAGERGYSARIPLSGASNAIPAATANPPSITFKARTIEDVPLLKSAIEDWLARRFTAWEDRVELVVSEERLQEVNRGFTILKLFLGTLAGISMLVGGIGIMNIMLANVTERTREIGIRKALGATPSDIRLQFLAEAVAISGVGSGVGVFIGVTIAAGAVFAMRTWVRADGLDVAFTPFTILLAAAIALVVGLVFGTYPARRAARLSPIDAIRHE
jgi:putative ABC transport system permease protein